MTETQETSKIFRGVAITAALLLVIAMAFVYLQSTGELADGVLSLPWVPMALILIGMIMLGVLFLLSRKMATFEEAAVSQAIQN